MNATEAVEFMKKNHITHLRLPDGLELRLADDAFAQAALPAVEQPTGPDENEVGRTGQTRAQQVALFGTVFEADFPRKRA